MDAEFLRDLFSNFRPVTVRRMFSGAGLFADGVMFGLVVDDVIYLKAGDDNQADFEGEGLPPFRYRTKGGERAVMSYRRMPERLYDDPEELAQWGAKALGVAIRKAALKSRPASKQVRKPAGKRPARKRR